MYIVSDKLGRCHFVWTTFRRLHAARASVWVSAFHRCVLGRCWHEWKQRPHLLQTSDRL